MNAAREQLRQEREAFDLAKDQAKRWFELRLRTGYVILWAVVMLVGGLAALIIFSPLVPAALLPWALGGLSTSVVGGLIAAWRQILSPVSAIPVAPLTKASAAPAGPRAR